MKKLILVALVIIILGSFSALYAFPAKKVYVKTSRSVVLIVSGGGDSGSIVGAGSIISDSGLVITNAHVVIDKQTSRPYKKISVFIKPDEVTGSLSRDLANKHNASVIEYDADLDLALLKAEGFPKLEVIELANPGEIMVGEEVVAIGHPEQGGLWTLTYGRISGQISNQSNVKGKNVFQTDTSVNRGNSGGPLLDGRGYLVGVNTNIARLGAGNLPITGVNFAVKSSVVRNWMKSKGYSVAYGRLPLDEGSTGPAVPKPLETKPPEQKIQEPKPEPVEAQPVLESPAMGEPKTPAVEKSEQEPPEELLADAEDKELRSDTILTPKRPFEMDDLLKEVEKELEDLMDEMRMKIRKR